MRLPAPTQTSPACTQWGLSCLHCGPSLCSAKTEPETKKFQEVPSHLQFTHRYFVLRDWASRPCFRILDHTLCLVTLLYVCSSNNKNTSSWGLSFYLSIKVTLSFSYMNKREYCKFCIWEGWRYGCSSEGRWCGGGWKSSGQSTAGIKLQRSSPGPRYKCLNAILIIWASSSQTGALPLSYTLVPDCWNLSIVVHWYICPWQKWIIFSSHGLVIIMKPQFTFTVCLRISSFVLDPHGHLLGLFSWKYLMNLTVCCNI